MRLASLIVLSLSAPTFAAEGPWHAFSEQECEWALTRSQSIGRKANESAREAVSWLNATHPCVTEILENPDGAGVSSRFDVLFLCSGFMWPPAQEWNASLLPITRHFDRATSFGFGRQHLGRRVLRRTQERAADGGEGYKGAEKYLYLAVLLTRSFAGLDALDRGTSDQNKIDFAFDVSSLGKQRVSVDLSGLVSTEHRRNIRELVETMSEPSVRHRLIRLIDAGLDEMIANQRRYCVSLQNCESPVEFSRIVRALRPGPRSEIESSTRNSLPTKSFAEAIDAFLLSVPPADLGEIESRLVDVYRDLNTGVRLLNDSLAQFHRWRAQEPAMTGWADRFDGTLESIDRLSNVIDDFNARILAAMTLFKTGEVALGRLETWLGKLTAHVGRLTNDKARVGKLAPSDQELLRSIVLQLPQFNLLMSQSVESLRVHRVRLVTRLEATAKIGLWLGAALKQRFEEDSSSPGLVGTAAHDEITKALEALGAEASRAP